jgi:prepilin-type N-terminal cleavage/methylation domain-containing protein
MKILKPVTSDKWQVTRPGLPGKSLVTRRSSLVTCHAFTMVEIAISLAVIGIALVAIIGVLPLGMNVQRDNREATVIDQDATVFIEAIRNGARGMDDLTNYVYAITNYWTEFDNKGNIVAGNNGVNGINNGYAYSAATVAPNFLTTVASPITNGLQIIGLLSMPEFTDTFGNPTNNLFSGGYSNHIVAYVRSLSGPAIEKPPQDNPIIQADAFGYRLICENTPVAVDTNIFNLPANDPGRVYSDQLAANLHELRLSFLWPVQPNGAVGAGRQTFRSMVAGQIVLVVTNGVDLYFFQSQSFTNTP